MFDYLYKKEVLDIYIYLFLNKPIGDVNKDKIKNILYVSCLYIYLNFNDVSLEKIKDYFSHVESIDYLDNFMLNNGKMKKYYNLYPIHKELLDMETKNRYIEGLKLLKEEINNLSIRDYSLYLKEKEDVFNILEKLRNNKTDNINEELFVNSLNNIKKYLSKKDYETYLTYYNVKTNKEQSKSIKLSIRTFENKIKNIKFNEIDLLKDLNYKTNYSNKLNKNNFDTINLDNNEYKKLSFILNKSFITDIIYIILLLIPVLSLNKFITNNKMYLFLIIILIILSLMPLLSMVKDIITLLNNKKYIYGKIGFVNKIELKNNKRNYNVYLPKYNEHILLNEKRVSKEIKEKDLVIVVKKLNGYYLIKYEESRFL